MKASVFAGTLDHQRAHSAPMAECLRRNGVTVEMFQNEEPTGDFVVTWGWRRGKEYRGRPVLVMERGYLGDRFKWCSLGWDGLNGRARFPAGDNGERFAQNFAHLVEPWAERDGYVLILGQVPGDMSLTAVGGSLGGWYRQVAEHFGSEARFRPHPQAVARGVREQPPGVPTVGGSLADAFKGARLAVTFNSNSGVESVLAGVPTVATDVGSMAWPVTTHDLDAAPIRPDRTAWAAQLAWCQWTVDEISSGEAWAAVREAM